MTGTPTEDTNREDTKKMGLGYIIRSIVEVNNHISELTRSGGDMKDPLFDLWRDRLEMLYDEINRRE